MSITNKKILLTGGTGFIGQNILESFGKKYEILAPAKEELDLKNEDAVFTYLEKNKVDLIIHGAAIGGYKQEKELGLSNILAGNVKIFFNLVRAKKFYDRMIFFGSGAEYDKRRDLKKIKETELGASVPAFDEYSLYKYICSDYIESHENIVCLRLFGVYGKYDNYRCKFISNAILKNLLHQEITINQNVVFDYLFIDDLMYILDYFISNNLKFKSYNITPDKSIDLIEISNIINKASELIGCPKSKVNILKSGLNKEYTGDNSRLKKEIPNLKFTDYKDGIEKLFRYYEENIEKIDKDDIIEDKYLEVTKLKDKKSN